MRAQATASRKGRAAVGSDSFDGSLQLTCSEQANQRLLVAARRSR